LRDAGEVVFRAAGTLDGGGHAGDRDPCRDCVGGGLVVVRESAYSGAMRLALLIYAVTIWSLTTYPWSLLLIGLGATAHRSLDRRQDIVGDL
jgi:hypothetical protein